MRSVVPLKRWHTLNKPLNRIRNYLEALAQIAAILVSEGKVAQARERVGRQVSLNPQDPRLHNLLGRVLMEARHFSEAETAFKKAMALDGTVLSTYANLGELYARQGKVEEAIKEFETILEKSPQQPAVLTILGMLHEQQTNFPRATAKYEEALHINANFAPAANNLAWILLEHGGDKERALSYAETAWKASSPKDPHIADTLGWVYFQKQMYGKAAGLLKEAVDGLPEDPIVLYHYGMAQYWNDNNAEAKKVLTKFLTLSPNNPDAGEAEKVLAALLKSVILTMPLPLVYQMDARHYWQSQHRAAHIHAGHRRTRGHPCPLSVLVMEIRP